MMAFGVVSQIAVETLTSALKVVIKAQAGMPEAVQPVMKHAIGEFAREAVSVMIKMNNLNQ